MRRFLSQMHSVSESLSKVVIAHGSALVTNICSVNKYQNTALKNNGYESFSCNDGGNGRGSTNMVVCYGNNFISP